MILINNVISPVFFRGIVPFYNCYKHFHLRLTSNRSRKVADWGKPHLAHLLTILTFSSVLLFCFFIPISGFLFPAVVIDYSLLTDPTIEQMNDPVTISSLFFIVRHLNDGRAILIQFFQQFHNF
jgi:hypothetical protein